MIELATSDLLRVAIFSGFVGLVIFVASYASVVWIKRNRGSSSKTPLLTQVGLVALALGFLAIIASWTLNTFTPRSGVVDGKDLFVVHNRRDATVSLLADRDQVQSDAVVAEFRPSAIEGQRAIIDTQIKEALTLAETLQSRALPLDSVVVQRQAQVRAQLDQQRQFHFDLQQSERTLERDQLALQAGWARDKAQIEADLAAAKKSLETTTVQVSAAKLALDRVSGMFRQQLTTAQRVEERTSEFLALQLDHNRDQVAVTELQRRATSLDERYETSNATFIQQLGAVRGGMADASTKLAELEALYQTVLGQLEADRTRAKAQVDGEIAAARIRVETLEAERRKLHETTLVKAPFAGKVVYRHPSPGLAAENAPVLAISSGSGFTARVLMPDREAKQAAEAGRVTFALDDPTLVKHFNGKFQGLQTTSEPDRVIASFDVDVPVETVTALGAGRDVKVQLRWQPALYTSRGFQGGAALALLGLLCLGAGTTRRQPAPEPEAQPQPVPAHPDAAGTVVEFRSRRPLTPPGSVLSRDQILEVAEIELRTAIANGGPLGILVVRIDSLRDINKSYGREMGNMVLRALAQRCSGLREHDRIGRWSGEELVLLLPETDRAGVAVVAERIRAAADRLTFDEHPSLRVSVTVSIEAPAPGEVSVLPALYRATGPDHARDQSLPTPTASGRTSA